MASKKRQTDNKKKGAKAVKKKGFFSRLKSFFSGLKNELKQVSWPDKVKLRKTAIVSFAIIFIFVAVIFLTDTILTAGLSAGGFYDAERAAQASESRQVEETDATVEISDVDEANDAVETD
ncbi:MAG: preprotein translocase subunit SecE [Fastidiosipilaceae bacterium]|jgi:preprotein translocase SecE subunit